MSNSADVAARDREFVAAIPKVELHVHLEGSMTPETLLLLRHRHQLEDLPASLPAIQDWYRFRDFGHFIDVYLASVRALDDGDDFSLLARTTGENLANEGVRYAEVTFTPWLHLSRGLPLDEVFAGLESGRRDAEKAHGIRIRWSTDVPGDAGVEAADRTLEAVASLGRGALAPDGGSIVSFGLGGPEVARSPFRDIFAAARQLGLRAVPHAGEAAGPESIWAALDDLGADRIGHGIAAIKDETLMTRLHREQTVLEICPTSNVRTRLVPTLSQHPMPHMHSRGLALTVNSDDPPMFGTTLSQEYFAVMHDLGLSRDDLIGFVRTAVNGSFMPEVAKAEFLDDLAEVHVQY